MEKNKKLKEKSSLLLAILMIINTLLITFVTGFADSDSYESKSVDDNPNLFHIEVMRDEEGNANISENSITWKFIYNKAEKSLKSKEFELDLSEGMELKYPDIETQPTFRGKLFEQFHSEVFDKLINDYDVEEDNINNLEVIKAFEKTDNGKYRIELSETDQVQEIIFTTELTDESITYYSALISRKVFEQENEVEMEEKSEAGVKVFFEKKEELEEFEKSLEDLSIIDFNKQDDKIEAEDNLKDEVQEEIKQEEADIEETQQEEIIDTEETLEDEIIEETEDIIINEEKAEEKADEETDKEEIVEKEIKDELLESNLDSDKDVKKDIEDKDMDTEALENVKEIEVSEDLSLKLAEENTKEEKSADSRFEFTSEQDLKGYIESTIDNPLANLKAIEKTHISDEIKEEIINGIENATMWPKDLFKDYKLQEEKLELTEDDKKLIINDIESTVTEPITMSLMNLAAPKSSGSWDLSEGSKSGTFYSTVGGAYSTTAEVVGNEVVWKITISHINISGSAKYSQGISLGDIQIGDIKEMTSNTKGNVYPPLSGNVGRGSFNENKAPYAYKNPMYSDNRADSTTFTVRQPISPTDTEKMITFKAGVINTNTLNAFSPSADITLRITRQLPTTGEIVFAPRMVDGSPLPSGVTAKLGQNTTLYPGQPVTLNAPNQYFVQLNTLPAGYELVDANAYRTINLQPGTTEVLEYVLKKAEVPKGQISLFVSVLSGETLPQGVSGLIDGTIPIGVGETKSIDIGAHNVTIKLPSGWRVANGQSDTQSHNVTEASTSTAIFYIERAPIVVEQGALKLTVRTEAGSPDPAGQVTAIATNSSTGETLTLNRDQVSQTPVGTYSVRFNVPEGYEVVGNAIQDGVNVTANNTSDVIFNIRKTDVTPTIRKIRITVVDSEDSTKRIQGSVFKVVGNGKTYTGVSDANGIVEFTNLTTGTYTVTQESAPPGYNPWPETRNIFLGGNILQADLTVQNGKIPGDGSPPLIPGLGTIGTLVRDIDTQEPISGVRIEAKDSLGNTRYAVTDDNGNAYFVGLSLTQRYELKVVDGPYRYIYSNEIFSNVNFLTPGTGPYVQTYYWARANVKNQLNIIVHEEGDTRVVIPGAIVEITDPDGKTITRTTGPDGAIHEVLPNGTYKIVQKTTDGKHMVNTTVFESYMKREEVVEIPNKLIDINSEKRNISAKKVWGDPAPTPKPNITFELYANGKNTGETQTIPSTSNTDTVSFGLKNKYDSDHKMIEYTVKELEVPDYYAVYEKDDVDGYSWTVTNYEGSLVGECKQDSFYVSTTNVAYEVSYDGVETGKTINLSIPYDIRPEANSYGYGIAVSRERNLLYGLNRYRELGIWDLTTGSRLNYKIETDMEDGSSGSILTFDVGHALEVSRDGTKLFAKSWRSKKVYVYDLNNIGPNTKSVSAIQVIGNSVVSSGDIVELENGDLLIPGGEPQSAGGRISTGLYIHRKNPDGTYAPAVKVGDFTDKTGIEGIAMVGDKVIVTGHSSSRGAIFEVSPTPSADMPPTMFYDKIKYGTFEKAGNFADMAGGAESTCEAFVKISGTKHWEFDDPENRPTSITVQLYANGVPQPNKILTVTPDANGNWIYIFDGLPKFGSDGTRIIYSVREIGVPPGYSVSYPDSYYEPNNFDITNTFESGNLYIIKKAEDTSGGPPTFLAGAEFTLYKEDKETIFKGPTVTNDAGAIVFEKLPIGTYYLKETRAPEGFELDEHYYRVDVYQGPSGIDVRVIDKNGNALKNDMYNPFEIVNIVNRGNLELKKVDSNGNIIPTGATFELRDNFGTAVSTQTTGPDGLLKFENLLPGTYTLVETKAPPGYIPSQKEYMVIVDDNGITKVFVDGFEVSATPLVVENRQPVYPDTGGTGGMIFAAAGILVMAVAEKLRRKHRYSKAN